MYSVRSFSRRDEQSPFLATQVVTPNEQWTQSEYMGPSQLPIAVVSIACGVVIVLLLAYIVYLHRERCKLMIAHGKKQMRRITRRAPFGAAHDDLPDRLDALEKALRDDASSTSIISSERAQRDAIYDHSFHSEKSSFKHPRSLSLSSWTPALPYSNTMQESILSKESIYSQPGTSVIPGSQTLPTIQIHEPDTPSLSFDTAGGLRSIAPPPVKSTPPRQELPYDQLGEHHSPPEIKRFLLPEQRHSSFSSMLDHITVHESEESGVDDLLKSKQAKLSIRLIPPHDTAASCHTDTTCLDSVLPTPTPSLFSGPPSPLHPTFEEFSDRLETIRKSIICPEGPASTTLDDLHEEIKLSYRTFLGMVEQGLFDPPKGSPAEQDHAGRAVSILFHDPDARTTTDERVTLWLQDLDTDLGLDEEGASELSTRLVSMLIKDLRSRTSIAVDESYRTSHLGNKTTPPRSRNPVRWQLEEETVATIHMDASSFSLHSSMSLDTATRGFHLDRSFPPFLGYSNSSPDLYRTQSCSTRSRTTLPPSPTSPYGYWSELPCLDL